MTRLRIVPIACLLALVSLAPGVRADGGNTGRVKEVTFDEIELDLKKGDPYDSSLLTDKVKKLDGKTIRHSRLHPAQLSADRHQAVHPGARQHGVLLRTGGAAARLRRRRDGGSATTSYTVRPVSVEGNFTIRELKGPDGNYLAIYHLDGKQVK